ncbi:putative molybdopterin biosynthesis protein MoeA/LysR substrate binding-domain-containing protein [Methylibium sp. T29-B]|nr:putative molybdopterin biosynthesis protein MoeA/LysR substrate binding-domain-containing protein [Methylibium sp. T29-B]
MHSNNNDDSPAPTRSPQRVQLTYSLGTDGAAGPVHHPLFALLDALHRGGSISAAATALGFSYRHVWGELRRWETELGRSLIIWNKGQRAVLTSFGDKLLWAERRAQARLAPQIESLRMELERAFADAFDDRVDVLSVCASHDQALPLLRELALAEQLHLDIEFAGSLDALHTLDAGGCLLAGFHVLDGVARGSVSARTYRARLKPGHHKLIGFAQRVQGVMTAPGNPLKVGSLHDLSRPGLRWVGRPEGTGTRVLLEELIEQAGLKMPEAFALIEPSHGAAAQPWPAARPTRPRAGGRGARRRTGLRAAGPRALLPRDAEVHAGAASGAAPGEPAGLHDLGSHAGRPARLPRHRARRGAGIDEGTAVVELPQQALRRRR